MQVVSQQKLSIILGEARAPPQRRPETDRSSAFQRGARTPSCANLALPSLELSEERRQVALAWTPPPALSKPNHPPDGICRAQRALLDMSAYLPSAR